MMPNIGIVLLAGLIPMIIAFIYYNPKVLGTAWMKASGVTEEKIKGGNMLVIFGVSFALSFLLAFILSSLVIHQGAIYSLHANDEGFMIEGSATMNRIHELMLTYGDRFRTFGHGSFHGVIIGLFLALPILGTNALFERKSFKYIMINVGYWVITIGLMGGVLCKWA
ncbi:MAG: hypothetical protein ACI865_003256 [Flavobacteriaceae bacterium]|jgi:hypothetical protein